MSFWKSLNRTIYYINLLLHFIPRSAIPPGDDDVDVADDVGVADEAACAWVSHDNGGRAGDDNSHGGNDGNGRDNDQEDDAWVVWAVRADDALAAPEVTGDVAG